MSNIPKARRVIELVLAEIPMSPLGRRRLRYALKLMMRRHYERRASRKREQIDKAMIRRIFMLVRNTDMTFHQIANKVGLRSSGRVSEVIHGKRRARK